MKNKILLLDVETAPILARVWDIWDQNIALNQIESDWHLLSWSAKWLDDPPNKIMYMDQRNAKNIEDDTKILKEIWKLLDQASVVVGQNLDRFDIKRLNTRFILAGLPPPSPYRTIDTLKISKKKFAFTSNKLEFLSEKLAKKYKKLKHKKFPGFELWKACLAKPKILAAWKEMELYNKVDVLALEEVYKRLAPWDNAVNLNVLNEEFVCSCGSKKLHKRGFKYSNTTKKQVYRCANCGKHYTDSVNLLKDTKKILR